MIRLRFQKLHSSSNKYWKVISVIADGVDNSMRSRNKSWMIILQHWTHNICIILMHYTYSINIKIYVQHYGQIFNDLPRSNNCWHQSNIKVLLRWLSIIIIIFWYNTSTDRGEFVFSCWGLQGPCTHSCLKYFALCARIHCHKITKAKHKRIK